MGDIHSNIHPGDLVRVRTVNSRYADDETFAHLEGKEGIVTPIPGVAVEEWENIVSFINEDGQEEIAIFTDTELEVVHKNSISTIKWMNNVMSFFKRR